MEKIPKNAAPLHSCDLAPGSRPALTASASPCDGLILTKVDKFKDNDLLSTVKAFIRPHSSDRFPTVQMLRPGLHGADELVLVAQLKVPVEPDSPEFKDFASKFRQHIQQLRVDLQERPKGRAVYARPVRLVFLGSNGKD